MRFILFVYKVYYVFLSLAEGLKVGARSFIIISGDKQVNKNKEETDLAQNFI